jgi:hypothetical protein
VRDDRLLPIGVDDLDAAGSEPGGVLLADPPSTMTAWTGVLAGPFSHGEEDFDEALSLLQAELDEKGREAQYRIEVETADDGPARARASVTAWVGVLVGLLAPIAILESRWPGLRLAATVIFVLAGFGPGIMCWVDTGEAWAQAGLTIAFSAAAFALAASGMIWLAAWHPMWLLALAAPSVLSCLIRLYRLHAGLGRHAPSSSPSRA